MMTGRARARGRARGRSRSSDKDPARRPGAVDAEIQEEGAAAPSTAADMAVWETLPGVEQNVQASSEARVPPLHPERDQCNPETERDSPRDFQRDQQRDRPQDQPRDFQRDLPRDQPRDQPRDRSRDQQRDTPRDQPQPEDPDSGVTQQMEDMSIQYRDFRLNREQQSSDQQGPQRRPGPSRGGGGGVRGRERGRGRGGPGRGGGRGRGRGRGRETVDESVRLVSDIGFKTRPTTCSTTHGEDGESEVLMSNHTQVVVHDDVGWYQYQVDFAPLIERFAWKTEMIAVHNKDALQTAGYLFNGTALWMRIKLHKNPLELFSKHPQDDSNVRITLRFTNEMPSTSPEILSLLNLMLRNMFKAKGHQLVGRNYYETNKTADIPEHHMKVMRGFATSILNYETGCQLQVDLSHRVVRTVTVLDRMYELQMREKQRGRPENAITAITRDIVGNVVMLRYRNQTHRIADIDWKSSVMSRFKSGDKQITYAEYFEKVYAVKDLDPEQPLLLMMLKKADKNRGLTKICVPPQLCVITGLSEEMRKDYKIMQALAVHTRPEPGVRLARIRGFIKDMNTDPESCPDFKRFGISLAPDLLRVTGRRIENVKLGFGPRNSEGAHAWLGYERKDADWSREADRHPPLTCVALNHWMLVYPNRLRETANTLHRLLREVNRQMNITLGTPVEVAVGPRDDTQSYSQELRRALTPQLQAVVSLVSSNKKETYDAIKKIVCIDFPISNQCVVARTIDRGKNLHSITSKIVMQIQAKLGAELWCVQMDPAIVPVRPYMVVGIDVYHDTLYVAGRKQKCSIVGVVTSVNKNVTRYFSQVFFQPQTTEIVDKLVPCIVEAVKHFHRSPSKPVPQGVIIYRDGVGDGMLGQVFEIELKGQLLPALQKIKFGGLYSYNPKVTFIVVKKRIMQRFFRRDPAGGAVVNPLPGTVVDSVVTRPEWFDFFLISQSVRQGTVSPTHFNVIWDEMGWTPDQLQKFTYHLTHLYYNWQGTIRVPAPCQYAHKVAYLTGTALQKDPSLNLADKLWYL